jgi:uncharacterized membrane protein
MNNSFYSLAEHHNYDTKLDWVLIDEAQKTTSMSQEPAIDNEWSQLL